MVIQILFQGVCLEFSYDLQPTTAIRRVVLECCFFFYLDIEDGVSQFFEWLCKNAPGEESNQLMSNQVQRKKEHHTSETSLSMSKYTARCTILLFGAMQRFGTCVYVCICVNSSTKWILSFSINIITPFVCSAIAFILYNNHKSKGKQRLNIACSILFVCHFIQR